MNELALFAGAGGGILGGHLLGWRTVCAVERDAYAAQVLAQRQNDGILRPFPIWSDVTTFDGKPWRGIVDVISGGFPCTDISSAGTKKGLDGEASGLWVEMARIIGEVRPEFVYVENSPNLTFYGIDRVLGDLASMGFDARWGIIGANAVGANHKRERIWIVAHAKSNGHWEGGKKRNLREAHGGSRGALLSELTSTDWGRTTPRMGRVDNGVAHRMDRLKAVGNGQVPQCAAAAWHILGGE
jgi:DNA (cytosine-5)-methyltransferase 1